MSDVIAATVEADCLVQAAAEYMAQAVVLIPDPVRAAVEPTQKAQAVQVGVPGRSSYDVWLSLPGNAGKSLEEYFEAIRGPMGPPGASFDWTQSQSATVWTIAHNLGFRPSVQTFTVGGLEMLGSVQHQSVNIVRVEFSIPVAGFARLI